MIPTVTPVGEPVASVTRIAPTPSGYLHEGNCVNFLRVRRLAQDVGARLALRIDDFDPVRYRREYVDDIFRTLDWLDITPDLGPSTTDEFERHFRLHTRQDLYRAELDRAIGAGLPCYACECSRRTLALGVPCTCRARGLTAAGGERALRVSLPPGLTITVGPEAVSAADQGPDVVIWRRDDVAAYHLASLVEDRELGTTHVVRGRDLLASTAVQLFLAPFFRASQFQRAVFVHHDLITGQDGSKLSKSTLGAAPLRHTDELRDRLIAMGAA
mgnify:CR=1 FL=1